MDPTNAAREGTPGPGPSGPLDITVLTGGPSSERAVSLASGAAVAGALERCGHRVTPADIDRTDATALDREGLDVVFIALHGDFGESGDVQDLCEQRHLAYTGSDATASRLALDKAAAKQLFRRAGLTTPNWMILEHYHVPSQMHRWLAELPPPVVCKPVDGGSSVDITIARDTAARDAALERLLDDYGRALVEAYVPGREVTVGILADEALPVLEVVPQGEFYDYRAKYADDAGTRYTFEHGLGDDVCARLQAAARTAHDALGCRDMSRVDFVLDEAGTAHVLEINTIPGFTSHSLLPKAAARVGVSFEALVNRLVALAAERAACR
ncbi:MAG: D-alanine--D-alanine ligase [Phycisphaerae bacterium]|nr:D-alanine--D-alanine ligase [Phycisphaerae bacterium]